MVLYHPLNKENQSNQKAIEKYKDRLVYIKHSKFGIWAYSVNPLLFGDIKHRVSLTFKHALKLTKNFESRLEYHFIDEFGDQKPDIRDFDPEDHINCPTVTFDMNDDRPQKRRKSNHT